MNKISVTIGLLCVALLCWFAYFNDAVLMQDFLVGSYMPVPVYGGLILFLLLINPLLFRIGKKWFGSKQIAVIITLVLAACFIPGSGLMYHFSMFLIMPHHSNRINPGWQEQKILEMVPKGMLVDVNKSNENAVLDSFVQGIGQGNKTVGISEIPWKAWEGPMVTWIPLILAMVLALIGMTLVVHRQWSDHEQIPYPIISFANSLLPEEGQSRSSVFSNRGFQIGLACVFLLHMNNLAATYWPQNLIPIPRAFDFSPILGANPAVGFFPNFVKGGGTFLLSTGGFILFFTVIGFAYFLASDVSLALGIAPFIYATFAGIMMGYGVSLTGSYLELSLNSFLYGGAYFAMFIVLLYTGRHHYISVLKRGLFLPTHDMVLPREQWGMRIFFIGTALYLFQLLVLGLDWQFAILDTLGSIIIYTVISRVVAETGAFYINPQFYPAMIIVGFFGEKAVGPHAFLLMLMVTSAMLVNPREALMPFMAHGLKLLDKSGEHRLGRVTMWAGVAILLGLAICIPRTIYIQYSHGASSIANGWTNKQVPEFPFINIYNMKQLLSSQGALAESMSLTSWQRIMAMSPRWSMVIAFVTTFSLVMLFTAGRLRFSRWPLHPVLFIVLGTVQSYRIGVSFLIGWAIKILVTKYGGAGGYQKVKPFIIGCIAGEMMAAATTMIISALYYIIKGDKPMPFPIFPL